MTTLISILEHEIDLIVDFTALLQNEQEVLKRGDARLLPEITAQKQALIDQLNNQESIRGKALGIAESDPHSGTIEWLKNHPNDKKIAEIWKKMLELALQAKQIHEINGRLLQMHLKQTNDLLAALTRQAEQNTFYGSNGQSWAATGSRFVDSA